MFMVSISKRMTDLTKGYNVMYVNRKLITLMI